MSGTTDNNNCKKFLMVKKIDQKNLTIMIYV